MAGAAVARGQTPEEVLDRYLAELLQEMRVAITGVQILFAFLLTLPFSARFDRLGVFGTTVYTVTLLSTAKSPVVSHHWSARPSYWAGSLRRSWPMRRL